METVSIILLYVSAFIFGFTISDLRANSKIWKLESKCSQLSHDLLMERMNLARVLSKKDGEDE